MLGGRCLMHLENDKELLVRHIKKFVIKNYLFILGYILATIIMIFVLR